MSKVTISFEEQLAKLEEKFGVPSSDAANVFSKYKETLVEMCHEQADASAKSVEFQTLFGTFGFEWVEEEKRVNGSDGVEYNAPSHYIGAFAWPVFLSDAINYLVDFSEVPSASEIKASKKAA